MARFSLKDAPEVFVSTTEISPDVFRANAAGKLRKLGSRLYTTNLIEEPASLVRRHLWELAAGYFPGGLVADRTALEQKPAPDGSVFLVAAKGGNIALPGITLRARRGPGPLPDDFKLRDKLYCMSTARALLENMQPTRARSGVARTFKRAEIEAWLDQFLRNSGRERLGALRDQIKAIAPVLKLQDAAEALDEKIGALLGTRENKFAAPAAKARARGTPFDPRRVELFEMLHDALRNYPPEPPRLWKPTGQVGRQPGFFRSLFLEFHRGHRIRRR